MSEQLTPEEIEQWRAAMTDRALLGGYGDAIAYMLRLHDEREHLRNLQPEDVTGAQIQSVEGMVGASSNAWDYVREGDLIAAAVRVMLGGDSWTSS